MMNLKWTLSGFGDEISSDLRKQLEVMKENGISHLEIRSVNKKNILDLNDDELNEVKAILKENNVKISAIGSPIGKIKITDEFTEHLERFKRAIYVAEELGTKYIRMFSFFMDASDTEKYRDEVLRRWRAFVDIAEKTDIILLHENEKDIYGDTPERCLDLLQTIDSPSLRATFDPANFIQVQSEPFPKGYFLLKEYIEYIHIKDARYSDKKVQPAGQGDGNFPEFLAQLQQDGYQGFLSFEPHLTSDSEPGGGEEKFALAVRSLKHIVNSLETIEIE
jgi:sugar phosphate isomerase/epimerase